MEFKTSMVNIFIFTLSEKTKVSSRMVIMQNIKFKITHEIIILIKSSAIF